MSHFAPSAAVRRLTKIPSEGSSRILLLIAAAIGAALGLALGYSLNWSGVVTAESAMALGLATLIGRSLIRTVLCLIAAIGLAAAFVAAVVAMDASLLATLRIDWAWVSHAWWVLVPALALLYRRREDHSATGVVELLGGLASVLTAIVLGVKIDLAADMLSYLVQYEDNQAWVALLTQIDSSPHLGVGFLGFGPVIPMLLGLLQSWQAEGSPMFNAAYSAFMLAIILTPLVVVGLVRRSATHRAVVSLAFAALVIVWALHVPMYLFSNYGHLSASWAFLALIAVGACLTGFPKTSRSLIVATMLAYVIGAVWFPLTPLAVALIAYIGFVNFRNRPDKAWLVGLAVQLAAALLLLNQLLLDTLGLRGGAQIAAAKDTLTGLYAAQGGTAALDPTLQLVVLVGIVGVAFVRVLKTGPPLTSSRLALGAMGYVGLVYVGAYLLKVQGGYGPTKLWYVVGSVVVIMLIALVAYIPMPPRALVASLLALLIASFFYGGTSKWLARDWTGVPTTPAWLPTITAVAAQNTSMPPHPIGCFSNDAFQAYVCTRWAAGLTTAGDNQFIRYRLQVVNGMDPNEELDRIAADGTLANSWVIMLDEPTVDHAWGWKLIDGAGQVFGVDGKLLDPQPVAPAGQ